ncbi:MAG: LicD family protein [Prevotella sp.]|nr:LicD family protein [Prevotella sp.]
MTECERLINEGLFHKDFLNEEVRDDFKIDSKRKKIWMVTLDLLIKFDQVCRKHGLRYYLFYGSLLGAIRHKGFIPWDDDIDVLMPRKDVEKLILLGDEFTPPYYLMSPYTEEGFFYSFPKLCNANTTCFTKVFAYQPYHQGINLDIFVMDNVVPSDFLEDYERIGMLAYENSTYMRKSYPYLNDKDLERVKKHSGRAPLEVYEEIQNIAKKHINDATGWVSAETITAYNAKKNLFPSKWFEESVDVDFEGFKFFAPKHYEEILETIYGDWEKFPPIEERGKWHSYANIDADVPYKEFKKRYQSFL